MKNYLLPAKTLGNDGDFYLASSYHLRNNFAVKNKILLLIAVIGALFTAGCVSFNG